MVLRIYRGIFVLENFLAHFSNPPRINLIEGFDRFIIGDLILHILETLFLTRDMNQCKDYPVMQHRILASRVLTAFFHLIRYSR